MTRKVGSAAATASPLRAAIYSAFPFTHLSLSLLLSLRFDLISPIARYVDSLFHSVLKC